MTIEEIMQLAADTERQAPGFMAALVRETWLRRYVPQEFFNARVDVTLVYLQAQPSVLRARPA